MKKIVLFAALFISLFTFSQNDIGEKKLKLEIRSSNTDNVVHRKNNDHSTERIDLKKEDRKEPLHKSVNSRHTRPHLDKQPIDKSTKGEVKKEHPADKKQEHHHDKLQHRQERKENRGK